MSMRSRLASSLERAGISPQGTACRVTCSRSSRRCSSTFSITVLSLLGVADDLDALMDEPLLEGHAELLRYANGPVVGVVRDRDHAVKLERLFLKSSGWIVRPNS